MRDRQKFWMLSGSVLIAMLLITFYYRNSLSSVNSIVSTVCAVLSVYLAYVVLDRRKVDPDGTADLRKIADDLADRLREQWRRYSEHRKLDDPAALTVSWTAAEASLRDDWDAVKRRGEAVGGPAGQSVQHAWASAPRELAGSGDDLSEILDRVPSGRLVALGGLGAGKTALMVGLVLKRLELRDQAAPVPVLVTITDWNPRKQKLVNFMTARLAVDYPLLADPPSSGRAASNFEALLQGNLILPVIDGLDEIRDSDRGYALAKIGYELRNCRQVVVTCRTKQYRDAISTVPRPVLYAGVVQLEPLTMEQVSRYLTADSTGLAVRARMLIWGQLLPVMRPAVASALSTPLMASLAAEIYNPRPGESQGEPPNPKQLLGLRTKEAVESHLLGAFIGAVYRPSGAAGQRTWPPPNRARRWLTFLARHLEDAGTLDFEWWNLRTRGSRLIGGLLLGAASAGVFWLAGWIAGGREYGHAYGAAYASAFGVAGFLSFTFGRRFRPARAEFQPRGWALDFSVWFTVGMLLTVFSALAIGNVLILAGAPVVGLAFGAYSWVNTPSLTSELPGPRVTLARDRVGTLAFASLLALGFGTIGGLAVAGPVNYGGPLSDLTSVIIGVVVAASASAVFAARNYGRVGGVSYGVAGAVVGLLATEWGPDVSGPWPGIGFGIAFGVGIAMTAIASRSWGSYMLCRAVLAMGGRLPWTLQAFLADAYRRDALRQVGAIYQFRHPELQRLLGSERDARSAAKE